jgi:hypothetical protein
LADKTAIEWTDATPGVNHEARAAEFRRQLSAEREHGQALEREIREVRARNAELERRINTPELEHFDAGVPLEAAHQVERWGEAHDRSKSAENWYWIVGYLAGKALRASITGDRAKALHHTISAAGALRNWHRAIQQDESGAGIGRDEDLAP